MIDFYSKKVLGEQTIKVRGGEQRLYIKGGWLHG